MQAFAVLSTKSRLGALQPHQPVIYGRYRWFSLLNKDLALDGTAMFLSSPYVTWTKVL